MLQNIHDRAQGVLAWIIVGLISVPFALWGIHHYSSPAQKDLVAEVNEAELFARDFQWEVKRRHQQLQALAQRNIDLSFMEKQIKQDTLDNMIEEAVLTQTAVDYGLRIGDALLAKYIHSSKEFTENDVFSQEKYEQLLQNQGFTPVQFERKRRQDMLTNQVVSGVVRSAFLTEYDQQQQTRLEQQQRYLSYLIVPVERFVSTVTVNDADVEAYYNEHRADYMTPEKVSVEYVEFSQKNITFDQTVDEETLKQIYQERLAAFTVPAKWQARHILTAVAKDATPEQTKAAEQKSKDLLARLRKGEAFDTLAKEFSDDPGSAKEGGNLEWFEAGTMVQPFEEALKSMKINDISEPVKTEFGWHIIQLLGTQPETTKPLADVREELVQAIQKEKITTAFDSQAEQFAALAFENSDTLSVVAKTLNLEIKTTELFDKTGIKGDPLFSSRKVIDAAFTPAVLKENYNSDVIDIEPQHILVLRLKERQAPEQKTLATVKTDIVSVLTQQKAKAETKTLSENLLQKIKQGENPDNVAKTHGLTWSSAQWIKRQESQFKYPTIVQEIFKMGHPQENKALYQRVELENGDYALITLLAVKDAPAEKKDEKEAEQAKKQFQFARGESDFLQMVAALKAKAEIKTYPDNM